MLAPVLDPFDGASQELRRCHDGDVLGVDAELGTEAATHVGRRHPQSALVEAEEKGERLEEIMRLLRGGPYRDCVVAPLREQPARFDGVCGAAMLPKLFVKNMRRLAEGSIGVAGGGPVPPHPLLALAARGPRGARGAAC